MSADHWVAITQETEAAIQQRVRQALDDLLPPGTSPNLRLLVLHYLTGEISRRRQQGLTRTHDDGCEWCGATPTKTVKIGTTAGPACDTHAAEARREFGATVTPLDEGR